MPASTVLYVGDDHCVCAFRNTLIIVADTDPHPRFLDLLPGWLKSVRAKATGPIGLFVVLPPHNPPPGEEARTTIKQAFQLMSSLSFAAFVVEKTGFTAAAQRAALSMVMLAARAPFAMKVFATVAEGTQWVVGNFGEEAQLTARDLDAAVEEVRRGYADKTLRKGP